jgi:hypothetical protein
LRKKDSTPNTNYNKGIFVTLQIKIMSFAYILGQKNEFCLHIGTEGVVIVEYR